MRELDLEVAGEYILMAATLIRIKVRMLLPRDTEEEEEQEEDPRAELVRQLLEYRRFKEIAEHLTEMEARQRRLFPRSYFDWGKKFGNEDETLDEGTLKDVAFFDLLTAFKTALDNMPKVTVHEVGTMAATVEDQIEFLLYRLQEKERIGFGELMAQLKERVTVVVTFMALLELIRTHRIRVQQASVFGEIWISRN
jgi:segregation and condensation protein A